MRTSTDRTGVGGFAALQSQPGLRSVNEFSGRDLPKAGDLILAFTPSKEAPNKPGTMERLCVVLGVQRNPDPKKPPIVQLAVGTPIGGEEFSRLETAAEDRRIARSAVAAGAPRSYLDDLPEGHDKVVQRWIPPGAARTTHWRFDVKELATVPWEQGFKGVSFGGPIQGTLDRDKRSQLVELLNDRAAVRQRMVEPRVEPKARRPAVVER